MEWISKKQFFSRLQNNGHKLQIERGSYTADEVEEK